MVRRGCGERVPGGVYAVTRPQPDGFPLEHFLLCHPMRVPDIGLSSQGQVLKEIELRGGGVATLMFDWIGEKYYPNICDYLEEGRRLGFSWHIAPQVARALTALSWAMPVHPRAIILNWQEYGGRRIDTCPRGKARHSVPVGEADFDQLWYSQLYGSGVEPQPLMCSGYWWMDVRGGEEVYDEQETHLRPVRRSTPGVCYHAFAPPADGKYEAGVIARLPISGIEVIAGGDQTQKRFEELMGAGPQLPVSVTEE